MDARRIGRYLASFKPMMREQERIRLELSEMLRWESDLAASAAALPSQSETAALLEAVAHRRTASAARLAAMMREWELVDGALAALPPLEAETIRLRSLRGLSWASVSLKVHLSQRQAQRVHDAALHALAACLNAAGEEADAG